LTGTIDVHHHVLPDFFRLAAGGARTARSGLTPGWTSQRAIAMLDRVQIGAAVISISAPGVHFGDDVAARWLARRCNEFIAELVREHPNRFGGFAVLPLPDVEGSLRELAYALDELALDGVVLFTNARGVYLGDAVLEPLFAELQYRKSVVFVHPMAPPDPGTRELDLPDALIEFPIDTSRAVTYLLYSNTFARTPDVKYIIAHAGGAIPYLVTRFEIIEQMGFVANAERRASASETFRQLYWDITASWSDPVLTLLSSVVGIERMLFGTDCPYVRRDLAAGAHEHVRTTDALTDAQRRALLYGNAVRLFPRLSASPVPIEGRS
jgi:aminocarboxymuconate-semialdehyde decarboxylase